MDFRTPRPADRAPVSRSRPAQRPADESESKEAPKVVYRAAPSDTGTKQKKSLKKRLLIPIIVILVVAVLGAVGWFMLSSKQNTGTAIDSSKYQAIFFANGQVYFGKLHPLNDEYMRLTDVYYLQNQSGEKTNSENPQQSSNDQNNVQLVKLGNEIHGPQDEMIVSKDQMLFYENLKSDSNVSKSIEDSKN